MRWRFLIQHPRDARYTTMAETESTNVYVGCDLGSSHAAVSTSIGKQVTGLSYVTLITDKMMKRSMGAKDLDEPLYVFDEEAIDRQEQGEFRQALVNGRLAERGTLAQSPGELVFAHYLGKACRKNDQLYGVSGVPHTAAEENTAAILLAA